MEVEEVESVDADARRHQQQQPDCLYYTCFLLGCGSITPVSALTSAIDYFTEIYPVSATPHQTFRTVSLLGLQLDAMDYCMLLLASPLDECLQQFVTCKEHGTYACVYRSLFLWPRSPLHSNGISSTSSSPSISFSKNNVFMQVDWMLIHDGEGSVVSFLLIVISAAILGGSDGLLDGSFTGIATYLPFVYFKAHMQGFGCAMVIISIFRAITKAMFTETKDSLRLSARVFFLSSSLLCWMCLYAQRRVIVPHPVFINTTTIATEDQTLLPSVPSQDDIPSPLSHRSSGSLWIQTAKKIRFACLHMFLCFVVLTTIYPGVPSDIKSDVLGDWVGVVLVNVFSVCYFFAKLLPESFVVTHPVAVTSLSIAFIFFIPVTFLIVQYLPYFSLVALLIALLSFSNGYIEMCCFGMGQQQVDGAEASFIGGSLMSFAVIAGCFVGSLASLLWSAID